MKQCIFLFLFFIQSSLLLVAKSRETIFAIANVKKEPDTAYFNQQIFEFKENGDWSRLSKHYFFYMHGKNNIIVNGCKAEDVGRVLAGLKVTIKMQNGKTVNTPIPMPSVVDNARVKFEEGQLKLALSDAMSGMSLNIRDQVEVSLANPLNKNDVFKSVLVINYEEGQKVKAQGDTPKNQSNDSTCSLESPYFIPSAETENHWHSIGLIGGQHPLPILEKHTGWAIVYNYSNVDPVATYKRVWGKVNAGSISNQMVADHILPGISSIEDRSELIDTVQSKIQKLKREKIKVTEKFMADGHTAKARKEAVKQLGKIDESITFLNSIINPAYSAAPTSYLPYNVVPPYSNAKHVKRFAPTVRRDLLISVSNFHPYRDSFSLAISYNDNFMDNAQLFTSAFSGLLGNKAAPAEVKADSTKDVASLHAKKVSVCSPLDKFTLLRDDLKTYYMQKFKTEQLKLEEIEKGLSYIRQRLADTLLNIPNASEQAIIKRGQELADEQKKFTATSLSDYLNMVNDAAYWFGRISHYSYFDTKKIHIRNQDEINITLNRYRDGVLMTPQYEALRTYKTSGGFKLDFSVGLFGSALMDLSYAAVTTPFLDTLRFRDASGAVRTDTMGIDSTNRYKITKDGKGNFNIGPAVLMHFYWRTGIDINVGGTVGLSINQSGQPRYLLGGSLLLGRDSRWVISYGGSFGTVKALGTGLNEGDLVKSDKLNNNQVPLIDKWSSSWFFSVSFNFAGFSLGSGNK